MRPERDHGRALAAGVAIVLGLTACGAESEAPEEWTFDTILQMARDDGAERQVAVMEDGEVTIEDVWAIDEGWAQCYRDLGAWVDDPVVSPVDGWSPVADSGYDGLDIEHDEALRDALNDCADEWDPTYLQLAYEVTHDEVMAEPLMIAVRECLTARGYEVTGEERNAHDLLAGADAESSRAQLVIECTQSEAFRLYPDLPFVTVAF